MNRQKQWFDVWGRCSVAKLNSDNLVEYTEAFLSFYGTIIKKVLLRNYPLTWANTYHPLEVALSGVENFSNCVDFAKDIGKFESSSDEFILAKEKINSFLNHTYFNRKIALRLHQLKKTDNLSKTKIKILDTTLLNFSASFYSKSQQQKIQNTNFQLAKHEMKFIDNIADAKKNFFIILPDLKDIENIPSHMKKEAKLNAVNLNFHGSYAFSLIDDNYIELMSHCKSKAVRKYIYQNYVKLASNQQINNEQTLKQLIEWRHKKAKLNGHKTYTDYVSSTCGLDSSKAISLFLQKTKDHFEPDMIKNEEFVKKYAKDYHNISRIFAWDKHFIKQEMNNYIVNKNNLHFITIKYELAQKTMFTLAHKLFNIEIVPAKAEDFQLWHPDAKCFKVINSQGQIMSHIVFDILKREEKRAGLIYQYTLNPSQYINKKRQPSQQAIVMHLTPDNKGKLFLNLSDAVTLFHEFGHALHLLLTNTAHHQQHPFAIEYDAIEFPSQWFERFVQQPEILAKIAFQNKRPIGIKKAKKLILLENLHKAKQYWIHILHAKIDIHLNTLFKPKGSKSFHESLAPIFLKYAQKLEKYNQFQNNQFEHFFMGSSYYGYLWAEHMIEVWQGQHGQKTLLEQGKLMTQLLNRAAKDSFSDKFNQIATNPHDSVLKFPATSSLAATLID